MVEKQPCQVNKKCPKCAISYLLRVYDGVYVVHPWSGFRSTIALQPRGCHYRTVDNVFGNLSARLFQRRPIFSTHTIHLWRYRAWKIGRRGCDIVIYSNHCIQQAPPITLLSLNISVEFTTYLFDTMVGADCVRDKGTNASQWLIEFTTYWTLWLKPTVYEKEELMPANGLLEFTTYWTLWLKHTVFETKGLMLTNGW